MQIQILMIFISCTFAACSQNLGPGYQFSLFKNTPSGELAKAVEREDEKKIIKILSDKNVDINFQESKYGNTILHLAIANDKLRSTEILLQNNASYNIRSNDSSAAIHEAVSIIKSKKNAYKILKLLINYGADVNKLRVGPIDKKGTLGYFMPLEGAIEDLECSKLLLEHGANPYFRTGNTYFVWFFMLLMGDIHDNIYVAKYMIVDKKMLIPNPLSYTIDKRPLDILTLLNDLDFSKDPKRQKAKEEIVEYLRKIDFPQNGVYK